MPGIHKADVEKLAYNGEEAVPQLIGTLTEGAVLGDVACFNYRPLHQTEAQILKVTSSISKGSCSFAVSDKSNAV